MIQLTPSEQFLNDLESTHEWLYLRAMEDGKNPNGLLENFKSEFLKIISLLTSNPFIYSAYGSNNPTRRAMLFHGIYIIEYLLIPTHSKSKESTTEIILTSLIPSKSGRYKGAYIKNDTLQIEF